MELLFRPDFLKARLPKTPGINGKDEYVNTAVLVLLVPLEGEYHLVFQKRAAGIRQGGEICFPGGRCDPKKDVSFIETALRETDEEMGISQEQIEVVGVLDTYVAPMGIIVDACVGIADLDGLESLQLNQAEVEAVFSIPLRYFLEREPERYQVVTWAHPTEFDVKTGKEKLLLPAAELGLPELYTRPWGGSKRTILVYQTEYGAVWGITARFVYDLVGRLK